MRTEPTTEDLQRALSLLKEAWQLLLGLPCGYALSDRGGCAGCSAAAAIEQASSALSDIIRQRGPHANMEELLKSQGL